MTVVAVAGLLLMDNFGWLSLDLETKKQLIQLTIGYIIVEGSVDGVKAFKAAKSDSI